MSDVRVGLPEQRQLRPEPLHHALPQPEARTPDRRLRVWLRRQVQGAIPSLVVPRRHCLRVQRWLRRAAVIRRSGQARAVRAARLRRRPVDGTHLHARPSASARRMSARPIGTDPLEWRRIVGLPTLLFIWALAAAWCTTLWRWQGVPYARDGPPSDQVLPHLKRGARGYHRRVRAGGDERGRGRPDHW